MCFGRLDDLEFADNLALLSHNQKQMQDKNIANKNNCSQVRTEYEERQNQNHEDQLDNSKDTVARNN